MAFFKPKPNIADHEKARIEFHLQELAESIGFERILLPVVQANQLLNLKSREPREIAAFVGEHLSHSTGNLQMQVAIEAQEKCGGGG